jgi:1-deoxyxylulose-5-phosphate synthase|uniref:aldo/keto reductase n=1 Tax=Daejeonella sp. TaxID=2805397 RepID=UPI004049DDFE
MSEIGLGCVTFGREINKIQSFKLMDYALDHEISLFDTASAYHNGASETIVGKWLASRRSATDQIFVATKISPPYVYDRMVESVDQSLKRLRVDRINLLYFHCWDDSVFTGDALFSIDKLVKQGKIHQIGASNFSENQLRDSIAIQKNHGFTTFQYAQNNHNLAVSDLTRKFKELCNNNKIDIVTYSPLGAGFLTGKYDSGMIAGSRFQIIPEHKKVYFNKEALRKLEMLRDLSNSTGYSTIHLALVWALNQAGVKSVLIGGRNISQMEQAFTAKEFNNKEVLADLNRISGWII